MLFLPFFTENESKLYTLESCFDNNKYLRKTYDVDIKISLLMFIGV